MVPWVVSAGYSASTAPLSINRNATDQLAQGSQGMLLNMWRALVRLRRQLGRHSGKHRQTFESRSLRLRALTQPHSPGIARSDEMRLDRLNSIAQTKLKSHRACRHFSAKPTSPWFDSQKQQSQFHSARSAGMGRMRCCLWNSRRS